MATENRELEARIVDVARTIFIEKGYAETCMCDIAAKVGINRPVLHYYFRTKDKMYQAVFGSIVQTLVPKVEDVFQQRDQPFEQRLRKIVDLYFALFLSNPSLPLFVVREFHRDAEHLLSTLTSLSVASYLPKLVDRLREAMKAGELRPVPLNFVFYTFYGLLIIPFLSRNLSPHIADDGKAFERVVEDWKPYVVSQMVHLLSTTNSSGVQ